MKTLSEIIHSGWPVNIKDLPLDVRIYWSFRDELLMQNGIILKGNQVIIPDQLCHNILEQLHASHQGIDKTKSLAGNVCFGLACQNQLRTYVPVVIFVRKCNINKHHNHSILMSDQCLIGSRLDQIFSPLFFTIFAISSCEETSFTQCICYYLSNQGSI